MDLGVFPVRVVEANGPKHVSGGNNDHYTNNESAASNADSGDSDAFASHMRRNDENTAQSDKKPMSDQDDVGEQKVKDSTGDPKAQKSGDSESNDSSRENTNFVAVEIAAKKDVLVKKEVMSAQSTTALTLVGEIKAGEGGAVTMPDEGAAALPLLTVEPKSQMPAKIAASFHSIGETIGSKDALQPVIQQNKTMNTPVVIKSLPMAQTGIVMEKPGNLVSPANGVLADGVVLPIDLMLDAPIDDLPEIDIADFKNFKALKTTPMVSQPSINPSLVNFAAGLDDFQSLMDTGIDSKAAMIGGSEALTMMKSAMTPAVQALAAAQPAAATAAAQLVAAIRTESKSGNIEVRLDPPEMGRVRITLSVETADAVKAVLTVERPETLDHLRRNMGQFTEDLRMAGFTSVDVEFSENDGSAFQDEANPQEHDPFATFVPETTPNNIVYLSLRENAQLDLLV